MAIKDINTLKGDFADDKEPNGDNFGDIFDSYLHKSGRIDQNNVLGLVDTLGDKASKEDLANATTNFKGYHTALAALQTAYPQAQNRKDFFAWVGMPYPGTVYKVFADGGAWTDTGEVPTQQEIDLAEYAKITDLDIKTDKETIFNVSQEKNKYDYTDSQAARNDVPAQFRALSQLVAYKMTDRVVTEQFIGADLSGWNNEDNWAETGGTRTIKNTIVNSVINGLYIVKPADPKINQYESKIESHYYDDAGVLRDKYTNTSGQEVPATGSNAVIFDISTATAIVATLRTTSVYKGYHYLDANKNTIRSVLLPEYLADYVNIDVSALQNAKYIAFNEVANKPFTIKIYDNGASPNSCFLYQYPYGAGIGQTMVYDDFSKKFTRSKIGADWSQWVEETQFLKISNLDNAVSNGFYEMPIKRVITTDEYENIQLDKYYDPSFNLLDYATKNKIDARIYPCSNFKSIVVSAYMTNTTSRFVHVLDNNKNHLLAIDLGTGMQSDKTVIIPDNIRSQVAYFAINKIYDYPFAVNIALKESIAKEIAVHGVDADGTVFQTKWDADFAIKRKRTMTPTGWSRWRAIGMSGGGGGGDSLYLTPNDFKGGTQIERIQAAIDASVYTTRKVIIPAVDTVEGTDIWLIDSAILLPSNFVLELNNCTIQLSDLCRDNFIRTGNLMVGQSTLELYKNVHVIGVGDVWLLGANNPRSTGDRNKKLGVHSYGSDAGKAGENQYGGWLNYGIIIVNTEHFSVSGIRMKNQHSHGLIIDKSCYGVIRNMYFESYGYIFVNGVKQAAKNQDGMGIRQGCHDILVDNCWGKTADDFMNIGAYFGTGETSQTGNQNTISPSGDVYRGPIDDTYNIVCTNWTGIECFENTRIIRFMCSGQQKQYNIDVGNIMSEIEGRISFTQWVIAAGTNYLYNIHNISGKIRIEVENGVSVQHSTFRDIAYIGTGSVTTNLDVSASSGNVVENVRKITI